MTQREMIIPKGARGRNPALYFVKLMRELKGSDSSLIGRKSLAKLRCLFSDDQWRTAKQYLITMQLRHGVKLVDWREDDGKENYACACKDYSVEEDSFFWTIRWEE